MELAVWLQGMEWSVLSRTGFHVLKSGCGYKCLSYVNNDTKFDSDEDDCN